MPINLLGKFQLYLLPINITFGEAGYTGDRTKTRHSLEKYSNIIHVGRVIHFSVSYACSSNYSPFHF